MLGNAVDVLYVATGLHTERKRFPPIYNRLDAIRNIALTHPVLKRHQELPNVLSQAKGLAKARHRFAHWGPAEYRSTPSPALRFVQMDASGIEVEFADQWYTLKEIDQFALEVGRATGTLLTIAKQVMNDLDSLPI